MENIDETNLPFPFRQIFGSDKWNFCERYGESNLDKKEFAKERRAAPGGPCRTAFSQHS